MQHERCDGRHGLLQIRVDAKRNARSRDRTTMLRAELRPERNNLATKRSARVTTFTTGCIDLPWDGAAFA